VQGAAEDGVGSNGKAVTAREQRRRVTPGECVGSGGVGAHYRKLVHAVAHARRTLCIKRAPPATKRAPTWD